MTEPAASEPPPADSGKPAAESMGMPRNITAVLAYLVVLIGGIVILFAEKRDRFVRFHAMQSVLLNGLVVLASMLMRVAEAIFGPVPLVGWLMLKLLGLINAVFVLVWFVFWVTAMVTAYLGREWQIPYLGPIVRQRLARRSPAPASDGP